MSKVTEEDITQFYLNVADMLGTPTKEVLNNLRKKDLVNICYELYKRQEKAIEYIGEPSSDFSYSDIKKILEILKGENND